MIKNEIYIPIIHACSRIDIHMYKRNDYNAVFRTLHIYIFLRPRSPLGLALRLYNACGASAHLYLSNRPVCDTRTEFVCRNHEMNSYTDADTTLNYSYTPRVVLDTNRATSQ